MALVWTATANPAGVDVGWGSSYNFTSVAIGDAAADRVVIVAIYTCVSYPTAVKIGGSGGTSATLVNISNAGNYNASLWYCAYPTGTTADVYITFNAATQTIAIEVGSLTGATAAPTSDGVISAQHADPYDMTLTVPTGGAMIIFAATAVQPKTYSYSQGTIDYSQNVSGLSYAIAMCLGHLTTASGSQTVGISGFEGDQCEAVGGTWEPAGGARKWILGRP